MKYYAIIDTFLKRVDLYATRTAAKQDLELFRKCDKDLSFMNLDPNRYRAARIKTYHKYPRKEN